MSNNMHTLNFHTTSNIQHTPSHTSAAERFHMPMNNYQGQTNMVSSANIYETPCANNFNINHQGVSHFYSSAVNSQYLPPSQSMHVRKMAPFSEMASHAMVAIFPHMCFGNLMTTQHLD